MSLKSVHRKRVVILALFIFSLFSLLIFQFFKIQILEGGSKYRRLGVLKDGEKWSGDTIEEYSGFTFKKEYALDWLREGLLWDPSSKPFISWSTFSEKNGRRTK